MKLNELANMPKRDHVKTSLDPRPFWEELTIWYRYARFRDTFLTENQYTGGVRQPFPK